MQIKEYCIWNDGERKRKKEKKKRFKNNGGKLKIFKGNSKLSKKHCC